MRSSARKTAPRVRDGRVQRKNRWSSTPNNFGGIGVAIERRRPGSGFRHVVTQSDVFNFIQMIPRWEQLSIWLNRIILDAGSRTRFGWFRYGTVALCAMPSNLIVGISREAFYRDVDFFDRVGIPYEFQSEEQRSANAHDPELGSADVVCRFNLPQATCFHLTRTFLHELGHHVDRVSNRKGWCTRGEEFAERFGRRLEREVWRAYVSCFGEPQAS